MLRKLVSSLVLLPLVARAQTHGQRGEAHAALSRDSAAIAQLEHRIEAAVVHRDAAFLDSVYAPTFRFKHSTGDLETRAQRLSSLRKPQAPDAPGRTLSRDVDSLEVEVHGNIALTTGRIHVVRDGGDPHWRNYTIRYARMYARPAVGSPWMLVTHHSTSDAQGPPPPIGAAKP
jgi:hypothetical protein